MWFRKPHLGLVENGLHLGHRITEWYQVCVAKRVKPNDMSVDLQRSMIHNNGAAIAFAKTSKEYVSALALS